MALDVGKSKKALKKGLKYFKGCKKKMYKADEYMVMASLDFKPDSVFYSMTITISPNSEWISFWLTVRKDLQMDENEFNYKHKLFFAKTDKRGYNHTNALSVESDATLIIKAYADYMQKGDFAKDIAR
ncbi:MAG: hypothetical protein IJ506_08650 [Clostridia bacterium]|nr:hypothetical protein [Clostridia bacterium]